MTKIALGNAIKLRKEVEEKIAALQSQRDGNLLTQIPLSMVESHDMTIEDISTMGDKGRAEVMTYTDHISILIAYAGQLSEAIGKGNVTPQCVAAYDNGTEVCVTNCLYRLGFLQGELKKLKHMLRTSTTSPQLKDNLGFLSNSAPVYNISNYDPEWIRNYVKITQGEIQKLQNAIDEINLTLKIEIPFYDALQKFL